MSEAIPSGAVDVGGGVKVVRGGYEEDGSMLTLPSVSGSRESPRQDGEQHKMTVNTVTAGPNESIVHVDLEASTPAVTPTPVIPQQQLSPEEAEEVDSVGASIGRPRSAQPPVQKPSNNASELVNVSLKHDSGFLFSAGWDTAIVSPPVNTVSTLAIGTSNENPMILPGGMYEIVIEGDSYNAFYGNQSFKSELQYYVFILTDDSEG